MKPNDEMIVAAQAAVPDVDAQTVALILEAAMKGTFFFMVGAGREVKEGKSEYPASAALVFEDPLRALDAAQQLLTGANNALTQRSTDYSQTLYLPGEGGFSE